MEPRQQLADLSGCQPGIVSQTSGSGMDAPQGRMAETLQGFSRTSILAMSLVAASLAIALVDAGGLVDWPAPRFLVNKDFANYWIAANLVAAGQVGDLFSTQTVYFAHMTAAFGPDYPWHNWSYPPHYLLFVRPLAALSYAPAMAVFLLSSLAFYLLSVQTYVGRLDANAALKLAPFIALNLAVAQNGFLIGAFMLGALVWRYERPVVAGICAGCLTVKPQLGLLLPLLFLCEGRWTTIASAAVTAAGLAGLAALLFGVESWVGYVSQTVPYQREVMDSLEGGFLYMVPSLFGALKLYGVLPSTALVLHGAVAIIAAIAAVTAFRRCPDPDLRAIILVVATFIVTPYVLTYDLGAFVAVMIAAERHLKAGARPLLFAGALLPIAAVAFAWLWLPLAPLVLVALLVMFLSEAVSQGRPASKLSGEPFGRFPANSLAAE